MGETRATRWTLRPPRCGDVQPSLAGAAVSGASGGIGFRHSDTRHPTPDTRRHHRLLQPQCQRLHGHWASQGPFFHRMGLLRGGGGGNLTHCCTPACSRVIQSRFRPNLFQMKKEPFVRYAPRRDAHVTEISSGPHQGRRRRPRMCRGGGLHLENPYPPPLGKLRQSPKLIRSLRLL